MTTLHITRPLLEAMHLVKGAPNKEWRRWMLGICFYADGQVAATNGHVLAASPGFPPQDAPEDFAGVCLEIPKTAAALKKYDKAVIDLGKNTISYLDENGNEIGLQAVKVIHVNGGLPKVGAVIERPPAAPKNEFVFNPGYLALIEKIALLFEKKLEKKVYVRIRGNDSCAFMAYPACGVELKFMVAPIKV